MSPTRDGEGDVPAEMEEYLQMFLDETEEQLDDLVETMLALENNPANRDDLNEAFRLVHSIKGSAGMMGFHNVMGVAHALESRFEQLRSGSGRLNKQIMNLVLRCVDYFRECNALLRKGEQVESSADLLEELQRVEAQVETPTPTAAPAVANAGPAAETMRILVRLEDNLPLADLKAQLVLRRLADWGEVQSTNPPAAQFSKVQPLTVFEIQFKTSKSPEELRAAVVVEGVESVEFPGAESNTRAAGIREPMAETAESSIVERTPESVGVPRPGTSDTAAALAQGGQEAISDPKEKAAKIGQTMRVDIERLDNLMNLAGELVVNRARFVQVSRQISPALRKASTLNRIRDFSESVRRTMDNLHGGGELDDASAHLHQLRIGLELLEEQMALLENGRHCLEQIDEAIDQLSRVSDNLQRGILDTRMVPVGPLFNRFKRVVRDIAVDRGKQVELQIRGEKTELDKRMIDDLFDPLMHLVRNAIDHGLEPAPVRVAQGKPARGTISLEAAHSGNDVYIRVRDDGRGIDAEKIRAKLVEREILSDRAVRELSDEQVLEFIWHPGFSTSQEVTDVSGRGVGMDVVKTRIDSLNGGTQVESIPQRGTTFTLRLPLTLAIINSLLARMEQVTFSMPMDDVREIVMVRDADCLRVSGKQAFEVRGDFMPLLDIRDVFHWHGVGYGRRSRADVPAPASSGGQRQVVILHTAGRTVGLQVDSLLGSQDLVVKSLSDNFAHIRGLSGASILGDGTVCLMLDVGMLINMSAARTTRNGAEEVGT